MTTVQTQEKHLNITEQYFLCETSIFHDRTFPFHVIPHGKNKLTKARAFSCLFIKQKNLVCLFKKIPSAFPQQHKQLWEDLKGI